MALKCARLDRRRRRRRNLSTLPYDRITASIDVREVIHSFIHLTYLPTLIPTCYFAAQASRLRTDFLQKMSTLYCFIYNWRRKKKLQRGSRRRFDEKTTLPYLTEIVAPRYVYLPNNRCTLCGVEGRGEGIFGKKGRRKAL